MNVPRRRAIPPVAQRLTAAALFLTGILVVLAVGTDVVAADDPLPPTVTAVSPAHGPAAGGTAVTITGTELAGATEVSFGGSPAAGTISVDATGTELTGITSPACTPGTQVDVTVTTPAGTSAAGPADLFSCDVPPPPPAPTVTAVSPAHGPAAGGTAVTITGTDLAGATEVKFGGTPAGGTISVNGAGTEITGITSPAGSGGSSVDVVVVTGGGPSATGSADLFAYDVPPPTEHSLTVKKEGAGAGSVTCNGVPCAGTYPVGKQVTLWAFSGGSSRFAGWSGAGCTGTGSCTVVLDADLTVTAVFNLVPGGGSGGEDRSPSGEKERGTARSAAGGSSNDASQGASKNTATNLAAQRAKAKAKCKKRHGKAKAKCIKRANKIGKPAKRS